MGSSEIVGNQSVYWKVTHHDGGGGKKKLKCRVPDVQTKGLPDPDTIHVSDRAFAHDDIPFSDIGKNNGGPPSSYMLRLRFPDNAAAIAELRRALSAIKGNEATLYVPAVNRSAANVDPANPPAEIQVDW